MHYQFPPDVEKLVHELMAAGKYRSEDDVLRDALKALEDQHHAALDTGAAVIEGVRRGIADVRAGRVEPLAQFDADFRAKHGLAEDG